MSKRLLIVSNNVLSRTKSNGKTIFSFVDGLEGVKISQLYFSDETPEIEGYDYFKISDKNAITGLINKNKRGSIVNIQPRYSSDAKVCAHRKINAKKIFGKNLVTQSFRDLLRARSWKSKALFDWLDDNKPDAIFFCAGDSVFAYKVVEYITRRYSSRLTIYITDDYVLEQSNDTLLMKFRRNVIKKYLSKLLTSSVAFYTVSRAMQKKYYEIFGVRSKIAINFPDNDFGDVTPNNDKRFIFMYAGSLYYNRNEILASVGKEIQKYNRIRHNKTGCRDAILEIYSNNIPEKKVKRSIDIEDGSCFMGQLGSDKLKTAFKQADVLVFAESFEKKFQEKTKYSVSTKIPEYLNTGKPILAVGPRRSASMQLLKNVSACAFDYSEIASCVEKLIRDKTYRDKLSELGKRFYLDNFDKEMFQRQFLHDVMGVKNE